MKVRKQIIKYALYILTVILFVVATAMDESVLLIDEQRAVSGDRQRETLLELEPLDELEGVFGLIDSSANRIIDPRGRLEAVMEKLRETRSGGNQVVSILHIGDSHIQAGYMTERVRERMHENFGDAGRGLIVPYKLAGGNEPTNYAITSSQKIVTVNAVAKKERERVGVSGVAVTFQNAEVEFDIWSRSEFNSITLLHSEKAPLVLAANEFLEDSFCNLESSETSTHLILKESVNNLSLKGMISMEYDDPTFYGFSLENGNAGVLYHAIGSNGAAFEHIEANTTIVEGGARALNPDLIIISLGTNNSYGGNYRSAYFKRVAERFLQSIEKSYPNAAILLTTPMESCKRVRRGYLPNTNIADVARVLVEIGREQGVAVWDMYSAAGGEGANARWLAKGMFSRDRIHLTEKGYKLQGEMLYMTLANYYNNIIKYGVGDPSQERVEQIESENEGVDIEELRDGIPLIKTDRGE